MSPHAAPFVERRHSFREGRRDLRSDFVSERGERGGSDDFSDFEIDSVSSVASDFGNFDNFSSASSVGGRGTRGGVWSGSVLDPIWCEDPLVSGSNVLRNAFRVVQVLRAFGDGYSAVLESGLEGLFGDGAGGGEAGWR